jgi:RimJ/RimL family protein N-acetyltransferase
VSVELRVPTDADADAWTELFDDPVVMRYVGTGEVRDRDWYRAFVRRQRELADTTGLCMFTVLVGGEVAGFTGLQPWPQPWGPAGETEIGWRLGRRFWGSGSATAAAREALDRARAGGLPHVVALVHADNTPSIAVARKVGLTLETVFRSPDGLPVQQYGATLAG